MPLDPALRRNVRQFLELTDELGTTIRVAAVVNGVDSNEYVVGTDYLCIAEGQSQHDGVAGGNVRHRDTDQFRFLAILGHGNVVGKSGSADRGKVHAHDAVR